MANYTYLTQGGYEKIKAELDALKTTGRQEVARAIAEARSQETCPKMPNMTRQKTHRVCWK